MDVSSSDVTTLASSCQTMPKVSMPISSGLVEGEKVTVLRDTGCSGVVVRRSCVRESTLTGMFQSCVLADGRTVGAPVAEI